jgi:uncharacterized protein (DUF1015 family)
MQESALAPFRGIRPAIGRAPEVAAPPYDVVTTDEARQRASGRRWDFLHVSRPEIDLAEGADPGAPEAYSRAGINLRRMVEDGVLIRDRTPCFYVYRISAGEHQQTGIAAAALVSAYEDGWIKRHELTRPGTELDRARQIEAVNAHTGPVFVTYRPVEAIEAIVAEAVSGEPSADVVIDGTARHRTWVVSDPPALHRLAAALGSIKALYVADGHHRAGAAIRVARARPWAKRFLVVAFPTNQVRIFGYYRRVRDLNGRSAEAFVAEVAKSFEVLPASGPVQPVRSGEFGMVIRGRWFRISVRQAPAAGTPPLERLDVSVLSSRLLEPVLGIGDPRTDSRVGFVGGSKGLGELQRSVGEGGWAVGFSLFPTSLESLLAVADAGQVMPPKSTWFDPKLADGLISLPID